MRLLRFERGFVQSVAVFGGLLLGRRSDGMHEGAVRPLRGELGFLLLLDMRRGIVFRRRSDGMHGGVERILCRRRGIVQPEQLLER